MTNVATDGTVATDSIVTVVTIRLIMVLPSRNGSRKFRKGRGKRNLQFLKGYFFGVFLGKCCQNCQGLEERPH